jgi:hypothetical protein
MGPAVSAAVVAGWVRSNLATLDQEIVDKHLLKAFAEMCKLRNVTLTKSTVQKQSMLRAELTTLHIEKTE